jgi:hypothetical protein
VKLWHYFILFCVSVAVLFGAFVLHHNATATETTYVPVLHVAPAVATPYVATPDVRMRPMHAHPVYNDPPKITSAPAATGAYGSSRWEATCRTTADNAGAYCGAKYADSYDLAYACVGDEIRRTHPECPSP